MKIEAPPVPEVSKSTADPPVSQASHKRSESRQSPLKKKKGSSKVPSPLPNIAVEEAQQQQKLVHLKTQFSFLHFNLFSIEKRKKSQSNQPSMLVFLIICHYF